MEGCNYRIDNATSLYYNSQIKVALSKLKHFFENRIGVISLSSDVDFGGIQDHLY